MALACLTLLEKVEVGEPIKTFVAPFIHHLLIAVQGLIIGGFLLYVFEELLAEKFGPIMRDGFDSIGKSLAGKMVGQGSIGEELSKSLREVSEHLTPGINRLVQEGRIEEAVAKVQSVALDAPSRGEEEIAILLHSSDPKDWERVLDIANSLHLTTRSFLTVAYRFWNAGNLARAIGVAEEGLSNENGRQEPDPILLAKFKNSIAYYYADANRFDKADVARQYAMEAHSQRSHEPASMDTLGYVLITFGTADEVRKGLDLCFEAWKAGTSIDVFDANVNKAKRRLIALDSDR